MVDDFCLIAPFDCQAAQTSSRLHLAAWHINALYESDLTGPGASVDIARIWIQRLGSMISFQSNGMLFDGNGVQPDRFVTPSPGSFLDQGEDSVLNEAVEYLEASR